jgi:hypothetical protein
MNRSVQVECPACGHKQWIVVESERNPNQVVVCSGQERDVDDSFKDVGCQKSFLVRSSWSVSTKVGQILWNK